MASSRVSAAAAASVQASANAIALLRTHSLATLAHRELERMILAGDLPAGAKLNEAEVAARLGISRGPIREAFRALEESGLVRVEKNRGVFVRQVSMAEADEIYDVRASLDEMIGRRVAQRASIEQIAQLRALIARMESAAAARNTSEYYAANIAFHDALAQFAANVKLLDMYRRLVNELSLYRRKTIERGGAILPISVREHRKIVEAIAAQDAAMAGRLMFEHAMASRERMHAGQDPAKPGKRMMRSVK
ncbi:MAG: phosphonate utilization associated transcriptional regulator [Betaproteobacteria bacterium]